MSKEIVIDLEVRVAKVEADQLFDVDGNPVPEGIYKSETVRRLVPVGEPE